MFNYREKTNAYCAIKTGICAKIRLFFYILNHPYEVLRALEEFQEECKNHQAKIIQLQQDVTEQLRINASLHEEISNLKRSLTWTSLWQ